MDEVKTDFLNVNEVARMLGRSVEAIRLMIRRGEMRGFYIGGRLLVTRGDYLQLLEQDRGVKRG